MWCLIVSTHFLQYVQAIPLPSIWLIRFKNTSWLVRRLDALPFAPAKDNANRQQTNEMIESFILFMNSVNRVYLYMFRCYVLIQEMYEQDCYVLCPATQSYIGK